MEVDVEIDDAVLFRMCEDIAKTYVSYVVADKPGYMFTLKPLPEEGYEINIWKDNKPVGRVGVSRQILIPFKNVAQDVLGDVNLELLNKIVIEKLKIYSQRGLARAVVRD